MSSLHSHIFAFTILLIQTKATSINEYTASFNPSTNTFQYNNITCTIPPYIIGIEQQPSPIASSSWYNITIVILLTLFAGIMSGLTVGYLSIDDLIMELKLSSGTSLEKQYAYTILPVIRNHHWLLVTLLLCNSFAMEAMPIYLVRVVSEMLAIAISVTLILFFGEIIPQALCTGPHQLCIASFLSKPTLLLMYITSPISYPLSLLIDLLVGTRMKTRFANSDLRGLIELHTKEALSKVDFSLSDMNIGLSSAQANVMMGAIDIQETTVKDIMIPLERVMMLDYNAELDEYALHIILQKGFSRIPVYEHDRQNVVGILRIKQLIMTNVKDGHSLKERNVQLSQPIVISPDMHAIDLLDEFIKGKSHMAFITRDVDVMRRQFGLNEENSLCESSLLLSELYSKRRDKGRCVKLLGIVTLEDVIENMIRVDILDEDDYRRNKMKTKKTKVKTEKFKEKFTKKMCESFINENKQQIHSLINSDNSDIHIRNDGYILLDNKIKEN